MGERLGVAPIDPASSHSIARGKAWVYLDLSLSPHYTDRPCTRYLAKHPSERCHHRAMPAYGRVTPRKRMVRTNHRKPESSRDDRNLREMFWLFSKKKSGFLWLFGYLAIFFGTLFLMGERLRERPIEMLPSGVGRARKAPQDLWTTKKVT